MSFMKMTGIVPFLGISPVLRKERLLVFCDGFLGFSEIRRQ